jgi:tetratricopeptide (TPR) repeat protein
MSDSRNLGYRIASLMAGTLVMFALFGCPPPGSTTAPPEDEGVSQQVLDSLRADSLRRCQAHRSFAFQYAQSGLQADAITQFEKARSYCKDDADLERYYAQYLDQWGRKDSAYVHYRRAGELDTTSVPTHFWLYGYYHDVGDYGRAIEQLLLAARHQEDQESRNRWFRTAADMMVAENRQAEACGLYSYLQRLQPRDPELAQKMLSCVGDDPAARLQALRTACTADSMNRDICYLYARDAERAGNDQAALAVYQRFARADSNDIQSWESVIRAARRLNAGSTVLNSLRQLARLEPDNPERTAALVDELFATGHTQEGVSALMPKLRAYPENAHLLYLAGLYYSRRPSPDDRRTALEYLDRAVMTNDPVWRNQALSLHDTVEPPLTDEEINQAKFFGRRVERIHRCRIPGRERQNEVLGN